MKTDVHLVFSGSCREAFAFYEKTFGSKIGITMTYGDAPAGSPVPQVPKTWSCTPQCRWAAPS